MLLPVCWVKMENELRELGCLCGGELITGVTVYEVSLLQNSRQFFYLPTKLVVRRGLILQTQ